MSQAQRGLQAGRLQEALDLFRQHIALQPGDDQAHMAMGYILAHLGQMVEAQAALRQAIEIKPNLLKASTWLADLLARLGDHAEAAKVLNEAAGADAMNPGALRELADGLVRLGENEQALGLYERAAQLRPQDPALLFEVGRTLLKLNRNEEALAAYKKVVKIHESGLAHYHMGAIYAESSSYEEARNQFGLAIHHGPEFAPMAKFRRAALTPVIADSNEQIDRVRERIREEFQALAQAGTKLGNPNTQMDAVNFFLAYHGRPNKELQQLIANTYLGACPDLGWTSPAVRAGTNAKRSRIRLGMCSAFFFEHTIGRVTEGLLDKMSPDKFEIILFRTAPPADALAHKLDKAAGRSVVLQGDLESARKQIADEHLDVLFHTDLGMQGFTYVLAFSRLAPVQCVGWGHPDTTGIPNIDYYLSSATFEPAGASEHYSETLIALPEIYTYMYRPEGKPQPVTKAELGFDASDRIYLCAQSLFKVHPDFDEVIGGILARDEKARFVFFQGFQPHWVELLKARFERSFPKFADRVAFLPRLPAEKFRGALELADAIVDTKHFTGGHTTYLAFASNSPVVTWEGEMMRGRLTRGLYEQMGVEGLSATTNEQFVDTAVKLATDKSFREHYTKEIKQKSAAIYEDIEAVRHFESFIEAAHKARLAGTTLRDFEP